MPASFLVVPQWQGSGSARAMRLVDGAQAIRGDLPAASTRVLDVPLEAGESQDSGVARLTSLQVVRDRQAIALSELATPVITIGGDCGVELASVSAAWTPDVALVWFDAHPDLNTPESSPSGAFTGMVLRTLVGDGTPSLVPAEPVLPERVVLVGARAFDEPEDEWLASSAVTVVDAASASPESVVAAVAATGATSVYLHIDLDVLDPAEFGGLGTPEPFGLAVPTLVATIKALRERFTLAGAGITEFAPASAEQAADDLPTILRLLGALSS